MRSAFIFCGGGPSRVPLVVPDDALVIAADVGLAEAERLGVRVELLVGDMDSVDADSLERFEREGGEIRRYPDDKDATDLDLAIEAAVVAGVGRVVVVGGGGGRLDHLFGNALVMGSPRYAAVEVDGVFGGSLLHVCRSRRELAGTPGELISLFALGGSARGVRAEGLRWPLEDAVLDPGSSLGVSNRFLAERVVVEVAEGVVLAIRPGDEATT
ncbi:MAG TPA: thiamine diphosphokinase [Actinomycetota bacterium]|nr:thiamine diphosphokinase [Actinomycetota bacterium]